MSNTPTATIIAWEIGSPRTTLLPLAGVLETDAAADTAAFTWQQEFDWEPQTLRLSGTHPLSVRTLLDGVEQTSRPPVVKAGQVLRVEFEKTEVIAVPFSGVVAEALSSFIDALVAAHEHEHICPGCRAEVCCHCGQRHGSGAFTVCSACGTIAMHFDDGDPIEAPLSVLNPIAVEQLLRMQREVRAKMPS